MATVLSLMASDIDDVKTRTGITDKQLDSRIEEDKLWELAGLLGSYELYVERPGFGLNEADIADLRDCARDNGHQYTMTKAIKKWFNVSRVEMITYRSLVEILIKLSKVSVAEAVCRTVVERGPCCIKTAVSEIASGQVSSGDQVKPVSPRTGTVSVADEIDGFETRFIDLRTTALREIIEKNISVEHFRQTLMTLPSSIRNENKDFVKSNYFLFQTAKSVEDIFLHLNFYLSYIDFSLLEHIIKQFGSGRLKEVMGLYAQDMTRFKARTTISDALKYLPKCTSPPEGFSCLTVKFDVDVKTATLEKLDEYRKDYANQFLLSQLAFSLFEVQESSLLVTWLVPTALGTTISEKVQEANISFFVSKNILELSLDGKCLYQSKLKEDSQSMQSSQNLSKGTAMDPDHTERDILIKRVSDYIGRMWMVVARILGFTNTEVEAIEYAHPQNLEEQICQFSYQWKRKEGHNNRPYDEELNKLLKKLPKKLDKIDIVKKSPDVPQLASPCQEITQDTDIVSTSTPTTSPHTPPTTSSHTPPTTSPHTPPTTSPHTPPTTSPHTPPTTSPHTPPTTSPHTPPTTSPHTPPTTSPHTPPNTHPHTPPNTSPHTPPTSSPHTPPNIRPLNTPPYRLDTEVTRDSNAATTVQHTPAVQHSPNLDQNNLDTIARTPETEREMIRRKRLESFSSNLSNNSDSLENSDTRIGRTSSVPEAPPPSLAAPQLNTISPTNLQENATTAPVRSRSSCPFDVDDMVMVERPNAAPWYGVVKWIGDLSGLAGLPTAGIEMDNEVPGGHDGSLNGVRHFQCEDGRGLFLPVRMLKKDNRFGSSPPPSEEPPVTQNESAFPSPPQQVVDSIGQFLKAASMLNQAPTSPETNVPDCQESVLVFTVPADRVGLIIGAGGKHIRAVERETNTIIKLESGFPGLSSGNKRGLIRGSEENKKKALQMILDRLQKEESQYTAKAETIQIQENKVGLIIGTRGCTVNAIRRLSGATVDIKDAPTRLSSFSLFSPQTRDCVVTGSEEEVEKAKELIRMAEQGGDIVAGATLAALVLDLAKLRITVEEDNINNF